MLGKTMEVYIDNMLVKSWCAEDHIDHLKQSFKVLHKYNMKLNLTKCVFGVTSGKLLGYVVTKRGIEENPKQIRSILNVTSPKCKKDVQKLTERITVLSRFISRCTKQCHNFFNILKKNTDFIWMEECEEALQQLKSYLSTT